MSCSWPALRMYFQGLWSEMLGEFYKSLSRAETIYAGPGLVQILVVQKYLHYQAPAFIRKDYATSHKWGSAFWETEIGFSGNLEEVCIFLLIPSFISCLPWRIWKSFHIYLHSFYFPTETFHFSEIPNKYLLKSVSRWIFCLLIIILSYVQ